MNPQDYTIKEENGEMYAQFFLYNNEMNKAGDPINYQVFPENNAAISKSFVGRPYLLPAKDDSGNWINKHHRDSTLSKLFRSQQKYAAGEIVATPYNQETGNFNAVVKVFPEYHDTFRQRQIPRFTSPMLAHTDSYTEDGKLYIKDGIGVHLQGVTKGGYSPEISSIMSICEAGLNECMNELQTVAASGELIDSQQDESFSLSEKMQLSVRMSEQALQGAPPGQQAPGGQQGNGEQRLVALEQVVANLSKQLQEIIQKLSGQTDVTGGAPVGAAGELAATEVTEEVKTLQTELQSLKDDRVAEKKVIEEERQTIFLKERSRVATEIATIKAKLHKIAPGDIETEAKKLAEMKEGDSFVDLSLLHSELADSLKQFVGAAGSEAVYEIPEISADNPNQASVLSGHDVMERFTR